MKKLGSNAYRFGIEWGRLQSRPFGEINRKELDRYVDLLDRLKTAGITPMVVLHHFSNPPWISEAGGWTNPGTIRAFVDYATRLVPLLRDRVHLWNTFNEPDTYACVAYLLGGFPPGQKWRLDRFQRVIDHMARAHIQVSNIILARRGPSGPPEVGISKNWTYFHAYKPYSLWDQTTAAACHYTFNKYVLNAFLGSGRVKASTFIGLNYYGRVRFHHFAPLIPASGTPVKRLKDFGFTCDDMVERYPEGLQNILGYLHSKCRLPIYITEHGAASQDEPFRERDLRQNLASLHRAIEAGVDVRGFFYWSLLDNFEWQFGYTKKFGLLSVDFSDPALPRALKPLAHVYARICQANALVQ